MTASTSRFGRFAAAQAARIDALSLRERAMLFASLAAAMVAIVDFTVLSPSLEAQRRMAQTMQQRSTELDALRTRAAAAADTDTPAAKLRQALERVRAESAALDREIATAGERSAAAPRLADLLGRVLRRHERLTLVRLDTTPPPAAVPGTGTTPPTADGRPGLHTVNLSLAGHYHDLADYLAEIERTLPGLRWVEVRVARDGDGALLALRLQLLGDLP